LGKLPLFRRGFEVLQPAVLGFLTPAYISVFYVDLHSRGIVAIVSLLGATAIGHQCADGIITTNRRRAVP
jgi:hypothetical protein